MSGIVIAPFSHSGIRDWPAPHYARLIALLLERGLDGGQPVEVVGTAGQRLRANEVVRDLPAHQVLNRCGRMTWPEVVRTVRQARCLVVNNSGLGHLAGHFGTPTVSVFAGTHSRREWRALGESVTIVSRAIGCSPCQLDHGQTSPYDKACLRQIAPELVADAVAARLAWAARREAA